MNEYELWASGMKGKIIYDENEDQYVLQQPYLDFGLEKPLWEMYENKKVLIIIKVLNDKGDTK